MRNLDEIETALKEAKDALSHVEGRAAEVYTRIVGYYRSVRNWNKGKREEYGERRLYDLAANTGGHQCPPPASSGGGDTSVRDTSAVDTGGHRCPPPAPSGAGDTSVRDTGAVRALRIVESAGANTGVAEGQRVLLFVRPSCPACPEAKSAAGRLGIPVDTVNADTKDGMAEAVRRNVMSTPIAILLDNNGEELGRAKDGDGIASLRRFLPPAVNPLSVNPLSVNPLANNPLANNPLAGQRRGDGYKAAASM